MLCGFCHKEFSPDQAANACKTGAQACRGCPMGGCKLVRCPHCGYEMPREPKWLLRILGRKEE